MNVRLLFICLLLLHTACGFHLRGSQISNFDIANIYIQPSSAPQLTKEVQLQLASAGIAISNSAKNATYIVTLKEEYFEKTVLSTSATTGKVSEYEVTFNAKMDVIHVDGHSIIEADSISTSRDFVFDENAVLGNFSEEAIIREEIVRQAANQVLWRLQALLNNSK